MEWKEGKDKFLETWGKLGSEWGISRTMAQIHALLLVSPRPLSAEEIQKELMISVGSVNMNIRELMDWGLAFKEIKKGDRREYFRGEKDMWKVVRQIILNRKRKELDPVIKILDEISGIEEQCADSEALVKAVRDLKALSSKADATLEMLVKADSNWFVSRFMNMM